MSPFCNSNCLKIPTSIPVNGASPEFKLASISQLPEEYQDFADVFAEDEEVPLPPHRPYDLAIELEPGSKPKWGPLYNLGQKEEDELKTSLERWIHQGYWCISKSPMASPILFIERKNGKYQMCVDYHAVNNMTIKNWHPLPQTNKLINKLKGAKHFTKIDLQNGYNLIWIREGDKWKTAFRTKYGLFEWLVMPFGLTYALSAFQYFMKDMLKEVLDIFAVVYLDDILIFSATKEDHVIHVHKVLEKLWENKLHANTEKCHFHKDKIDYLGIIASGTGVHVDPAKVKTI